MTKIHRLVEHPSPDNTVMRSEQINTRPLYVNKSQAAELLGVSKSTIYKWISEAEESGEWPGLSIRPSSTITLINLEIIEQYLKSRDKLFL